MKDVEIFIKATYDSRFKIGTWAYYLNYKTSVIKRVGQEVGESSQPRMLLLSLYKAINCCKEPCHLIVHSRQPLGFKQPRKSYNKDMIANIIQLVLNAGHIIEFDTTDDFGRTELWEQLYGNKTKKVKPRIETDKQAIKTSKPDIENKKTPSDVFSTSDNNIMEQAKSKLGWKDMYDDLMDDRHSAWVHGSGGY